MKNKLNLIAWMFALLMLSGIKQAVAITTFPGDPLLRWQDPKDERFKNIDLQAFFSRPENIAKRKELHELRQEYTRRFAAIYNQPNADYVELQKSLTRDLMKWVKQFIEAAKPNNLSDKDYAFVAFGSAGRLESGIVTDLEGGLVLDEKVPNRHLLGLEFGKKLASAMNGLLGHPIFGEKGFRLDEESNAPAHYAPFVDTSNNLGEIICPMINAYSLAKTNNEKTFWKSYYYPFEGSHVLTASPIDFAEYMRASQYNIPKLFQLQVSKNTRQSPWYKWGSQFLAKNMYTDNNYLKEQIQGSSCGQAMDEATIANWANYFEDLNQTNELKVISAFLDLGLNHYMVSGNPELYQRFVREQQKVLDENQGALRTKMSKSLLDEVMTKWSQKRLGGEMFVLGKLPMSGVFDIKRHNYRLLSIFLTAMALKHGLMEQNQADIIDALVKRGVFGPELADTMLSLVNHLTKLRWLSQIKVQGQLEASMDFFTQSAYQAKLNALTSTRTSLLSQIKNLVPGSMAELMAKNKIAETEQDLALMINLKPLEKDSVLTPEELSYLEKVIIPVQHSLYKRIAAYRGNPSNPKDFPPNDNAFQDNFCVDKINLNDYGVMLR